ncbi:MAG TPA: Gfo/Idh/MocA family oxidoreductase [Anaerolinea sp.]|nr:Gfo/Idh/MocA family oxidoreductase [Anaerolinea sp.]
MINVGFLGAGEIAKTHAAAVAQVEDARLVAVYDTQAERAGALAAQYGAALCDSMDQLLRFPGLDLLYILTPPHVHADQIVAAADAGIPILCEKPITLSLAEADRAIAAARTRGVPLMTGQSHRYHPLAAQARELLLNGSLGDFVAAWSHRLTALRVSPGSWLSRRAVGGGLALQYALHDLDWERWLAGEAAGVSAQEAHTNPEIDIEDNLWALVQFQNGGSGSVGVSWTCQDPWTERGVIGSRGNLRILNQRRMLGQTAGGRIIEVDLGDDYDWFDVFVRESRDAIQRVRSGQPFAITGEDGRATLELGLAVQKAAMTHRMISLPIHETIDQEVTP